ncbi:hypothetical protein GCM10009786_19100 [Leucobacter alluvii]|uniref:Uncharacterized protein n=1 Tax=Leucobacter alluvii TaxID=340321 RepID=A0ABN3B6P6_9MICO
MIAVTGGSRGIGAAIAERVAVDGHAVLIGYRSNEDAASKVAERIRSLGCEAATARVDITDPKSIEEFLDAGQELGPLTGLVAAAGEVQAVGALVDLDPADLKKDLEINLLGAVLTARAAISRLTRTRGPIVLIGLAAATLGSPGTYVHYAAASGYCCPRGRALERARCPRHPSQLRRARNHLDGLSPRPSTAGESRCFDSVGSGR